MINTLRPILLTSLLAAGIFSPLCYGTENIWRPGKMGSVANGDLAISVSGNTCTSGLTGGGTGSTKFQVYNANCNSTIGPPSGLFATGTTITFGNGQIYSITAAAVQSVITGLNINDPSCVGVNNCSVLVTVTSAASGGLTSCFNQQLCFPLTCTSNNPLVCKGSATNTIIPVTTTT